jgi:hypothetical protein
VQVAYVRKKCLDFQGSDGSMGSARCRSLFRGILIPEVLGERTGRFVFLERYWPTSAELKSIAHNGARPETVWSAIVTACGMLSGDPAAELAIVFF